MSTIPGMPSTISGRLSTYPENDCQPYQEKTGACTFAHQTLKSIERLSAEPIQEKQGLCKSFGLEKRPSVPLRYFEYAETERVHLYYILYNIIYINFLVL